MADSVYSGGKFGPGKYRGTRDDDIREHAYHLWERAGKPEGRAEEFWNQAAEDIRGARSAP